jgi:pyruvate,water dikinase
MKPDVRIDAILHDLRERTKELHCLYRVDEILSRPEPSTDELLRGVVAALPPGWQFPNVCQARIVFDGRVYETPGLQPTAWVQTAPIVVQGEEAGRVEVFYREAMPKADEGPFLAEERKLLDTLAERIGRELSHRRMQSLLGGLGSPAEAAPEWWVILDFLRQTDRALLGRLGRKLINHLCWSGVEGADRLLRQSAPQPDDAGADDNRPLPRTPVAVESAVAEQAFRLAGSHLGDDEVLALIQSWIKEDKTAFLKHAVERLDLPLSELADNLQRFKHGGVEERELSPATRVGLRASLTRRFLTDQLEFVNTAKEYLEVADFQELAQRIVYPTRSHGRLGGKAAGLFLACKVVARSPGHAGLPEGVRVPKSWYIPSDGLSDFMEHNELGEVLNRKYDDPGRVRLEYPLVVQLFKSSFFPPDMLRGLADLLDDLEGRPIIVRSSSLLEDRLGSAFSGKYKSLFLANTGSKLERLSALTDAIAEVYASVFGPDPIEYRARRGFLDLHEEMGVLVQEVVGRRIGPYFLPVFAGVGFCNNELRWSPRIRREDGLLRLVLGLGTRAVDRLADDYPVLVAPGQPGLRVNQTVDETVHYAPKKLDVINLESGRFETLEMAPFLAAWGESLPMFRQLVSLAGPERIRRPVGLVDLARETPVVTFEGLISDTPFLAQMRSLLQLLREKLGTPVDIEFASDGEHLYLLQCRPQGTGEGAAPVAIPRDLPPERVLFTAHRYVSNGQVADLTHVVYVDPEAYAQLDPDEMRELGRAVGRLNRLLPKRRFALMGPGRWGSRGDIRLGVPVTYSDISNTALLVEIARRQDNHAPDLSFGTHFFQDLVESAIRYLPLYPGDPAVVFKERFFRGAPNILAELAPDLAHLSEVLRVIDVQASRGLVLHVLMNGEIDEAVGVLAAPTGGGGEPATGAARRAGASSEDFWRWRVRMAQALAADLDPERLGVKAVYLFGSTENATAGPASDIDLLIHVTGDEERRQALERWLEGWSLCLAEINYQRTGYRSDGLLDVHYATDEDFARGTSFTVKVSAITDAARPLELRKGPGT